MASLPSSSAETMLKLTLDDEYRTAKPMWEEGVEGGEGGAGYWAPWGMQDVTHGEANELGKCRELWVDSARVLGLVVAL